MVVEAVQCPSCGAPLQIEEGRQSAFCGYCGAKLRITKGSSGHPLAALDGIKADTGLLAKSAAYQHLKQETAEMQARLKSATAERDRFLSVAETIRPGYAVVVMAMAAMALLLWGLSGSGIAIIVTSVLGALSVFASYSTMRRRDRLVAGTMSDFARDSEGLAECIEANQKRMGQLKADLDELTREV
jgi:uncharacterized Zn finger protein (UPF0148 family)